MIPFDFHLHSEFSTDSNTPMVEMIEKAISLGLKTICFTDHMDYNYPTPKEEEYDYPPTSAPLFVFDIDAYTTTLNELKEKYQNKILLLTGIELGLQKGIQKELKELVSNYEFDFIIGSSHLLYGKDPYYPSFWKEGKLGNLQPQNTNEPLDKKQFETAIFDYFNEIKSCIQEFSDFQVYGHLDYLVRYTPTKDKYYNPLDYKEILTEVLTLLIQSGKGIEINTSGLKSNMKYPNPHPDILRLYRKLGGEIITFGSDAHTPFYINYQSDLARDLLKTCGFDYVTTFKNKQPIFHKL